MLSYSISPEDCLLICAFRETSSLREAARVLNCDPSSLVRKVQRISSEHGLIKKVNGRWSVTEKGKAAIRWAEESILSQQTALDERPRVRIATQTWISERIVIPNLNSLTTVTHNKFDWFILTPAKNLDEEIMSGQADLAIACHPPFDPSVALRRVAVEKWIVVVPNPWVNSLQGLSAVEIRKELASKTFIRHSEINPYSLLGTELTPGPSIHLDHLVGVRSALLSGLGWSCVPSFLVQRELDSGNLKAIKSIPVHYEGSLFVWWLRERRDIQSLAKKTCSWMEASVAS